MKEQCPETWTRHDWRSLEYGCHTFGCIREKGHEGQHFDHYGRWDEKNIVPIKEAQREMGIVR